MKINKFFMVVGIFIVPILIGCSKEQLISDDSITAQELQVILNEQYQYLSKNEMSQAIITDYSSLSNMNQIEISNYELTETLYKYTRLFLNYEDSPLDVISTCNILAQDNTLTRAQKVNIAQYLGVVEYSFYKIFNDETITKSAQTPDEDEEIDEDDPSFILFHSQNPCTESFLEDCAEILIEEVGGFIGAGSGAAVVIKGSQIWLIEIGAMVGLAKAHERIRNEATDRYFRCLAMSHTF